MFIRLCWVIRKTLFSPAKTQPDFGMHDSRRVWTITSHPDLCRSTIRTIFYYSAKDGNQSDPFNETEFQIIDNWISTELPNKLEEFQIKTVWVYHYLLQEFITVHHSHCQLFAEQEKPI